MQFFDQNIKKMLLLFITILIVSVLGRIPFYTVSAEKALVFTRIFANSLICGVTADIGDLFGFLVNSYQGSFKRYDIWAIRTAHLHSNCEFRLPVNINRLVKINGKISCKIGMSAFYSRQLTRCRVRTIRNIRINIHLIVRIRIHYICRNCLDLFRFIVFKNISHI